MLGVPLGPVVLSPAMLIALMALIAALPAPLLAAWRHDVLRRPVNVEHPAWFAWVTRVQALVFASALVTPVVTARLPIRAALLAVGFRSPLVASAAALLLGLGPLIVHVAMAVAVSGDVERRLRGISLGARGRLAHFGRGLTVSAPLAAGIVLSAVAATSGYPKLGLGLLLAGVIGLLFAASTRSSALGLVPQALTSGPLRERISELAARAGTTVQQVHVLGAEEVRMANAFAMRGGRVLITDHLLRQLSRREVDAIVAHELAHLKEAHPVRLQVALLVAGAACAPLLMLPIGPGAFLLPGIVGYAVFLFLARRFEYVADRRAAEWTRDGEALVSGLVRLARINHHPVAWSRVREWTLTHPSTRRRAEALVAAGCLGAERAAALLAAPADDPERWVSALPLGGRVFDTPARTTQSARGSWVMLAACTIAPTLLIAARGAIAPDVPRLALFAIACLVAFGTAWVVADFAAVSGFPRWKRALAERLRTKDGAMFVGLSPHAPGVVYENFADWDLAFLTLEPGVLRVRGELADFALPRERLTGVSVVPGLPGWHRTSRVAITWLDDDGAPRTFVVRDADARALHEFPARAERLAARVRAWRDAVGPRGVARVEGTPPDAANVSGTSFSALVAPATLGPVALLLGLLAVCVAALVGIRLAPWSGPSAIDVFGAGFATFLVMRLPAWRAGAHVTPGPRPASLRRAA